jgi:hypothetical protein
MRRTLLILVCLLLLNACRQAQEMPSIMVSLVADGRVRIFAYTTPVTVDDFLRDPKVGVEMGDLDRVTPPKYTQISDGLRITVVRVTEKKECQEQEVPFHQSTVPNEGLKPGEQRISQAGRNGKLQICYRTTLNDGVPGDRIETSRVQIIAPQDEIIFVGMESNVEPVPITGTLAYINGGNAWMMRGSSLNKIVLTTSGDLDTQSNTFKLSGDGRQLLFARKTSKADSDNAFNQLWLLPDLSAQDPKPVALVPGDVLYADWIPGQDATISYSTGEASAASPGWKARNDLLRMRIDPATGASLNLTKIIDSSGSGYYAWWGTRFDWSPDGQKLAWVQADRVGLVDLAKSKLGDPILQYPVLRPVGDWSWRATISWSPDSSLFVTTTHGAPVGSEAPETSPAFDIRAADTGGTFNTQVVKNAGIWASPVFSPMVPNASSKFEKGYLAYLQARDPFNSINGEYDLIVADRDGSNARRIFPKEGQPGLNAQQSLFQNQEFTWSPDGRQIAFIYQKNLWIIDVESEVAHQLTVDRGASNPVWTR